MSTEYFSPSEPTPEYDTIAPERIHELNTELSDHTTHFLDVLRNLREPDLERHIFAFYGDILDKPLYVPQVMHDVTARYGQIDDISITTSHITTGGDAGADLAINIELYNDDEDETYYLFVERKNGEAPTADDRDKLYSETGYQNGVVEAEVPAMSNQELNRMIGSLIHASADTTIEQLDSESWLGASYNNLADALSDSSNSDNAHSEYSLVSEEGGHAGLIEYEESGGEVFETSLYMVDTFNIDISPEGNLGYVESGTEVCLENVTDDTEVLFVQHRAIDEADTVNYLDPTEDDYTAALEFMHYHGKLQRALHSKNNPHK